MSTKPGELAGAQLDRELSELLEVETFEPSPEFRAQARLGDPGVYEEAARDPQAWWVAQAEELDWFRSWDTVLDDSSPPFYKWFVGGQLNASYNCLDRHVLAGRGDRVALHWRGEEGREREITYAQLLAEVQRCANALRDLGTRKGDVVGIYLPMIPERRLRRLLGGGRARADGVLGGEAADHGRRSGAQGQDRGREGSRG
jgi:acetyl-CoA synthetase